MSVYRQQSVLECAAADFLDISQADAKRSQPAVNSISQINQAIYSPTNSRAKTEQTRSAGSAACEAVRQQAHLEIGSCTHEYVDL